MAGGDGQAEDRFVAAAPDTLIVHPLDVMTAIHHRASGQTHVVASPIPELMAALATPGTRGEAMARLHAAYDVADADPAALSARIDELVAAGLVQRL